MAYLKIATFNINNINKRLAVLLEWLSKASPDVVCLQELKVPDTRFPLREIEAAGYGARWVGQPSWNGVAILAKGMRLDHILLTASLSPGLREAGVDAWVRGLPGASDHAPAWANIVADGPSGARGAAGRRPRRH